ncbi:hypothetical protein ACFE04_007190 [Oxalis oulophora]
MGLAGLSVREDAVGNIFGQWDGSEPELPAVATGSHIDAIPYSGKYDGVVGVLGAVEAINALKRYGWNSELLIGGINVWVQTQKITGGYFVHLKRAYTLWDQLLGNTSIGVVTAIAAPASIKVDLEGSGGHAGEALMPSRNDAGLAAAELALAVEKHVLDSGSIDTVGTVVTSEDIQRLASSLQLSSMN